jgi:hypothetical protein
MGKEFTTSKDEMVADMKRVHGIFMQDESNHGQVMTRYFYRKHGRYSDASFEGEWGGFAPFRDTVLKEYLGRVRESETARVEKRNEQVVFEQEQNEATVTNDTTRIVTLEQLLEHSKVDLDIWNVDRHVTNKWEVGAKDLAGNIVTSPLFQVKAWLSKKLPDEQQFPTIKKVRFNMPELPPRPVMVKPFKTTIVIGDSQIGFLRSTRSNELKPFHDRRAMDIVLQVLSEKQPDEVILLGDMLDMTEASKYRQLPEFFNTMQPAINELGWYIHMIRLACPNAKIVFMHGNHEQRLPYAIMDNMHYSYKLKPYNKDFEVLSLANLLNLKEVNVDIIEDYPSGEYWVNDVFKIVHGEHSKPARELKVTGVSTLMGHFHKIGTESKTIFNRDERLPILVSTIGCLCTTDGTVPATTSKPEWQQGFAYIESTDNDFNLNHIRIRDGVALFQGKVYVGGDYGDEIQDILYNI